MKKYAVIVAAGLGKRMNSNTPKQFMLLSEKPMLYYTINTFLKSFKDIEIILVLPKEYIEEGEKIITTFFNHNNITVIPGGPTRFHSVQHGLNHVNEKGIVFVHDGVRALVTEMLIQRCYKQAIEIGSAIPVIVCKDSVRIVNGDKNQAIDRNNIRLIQTPQTFKTEVLLPAFNVEYKELFTDEATTVEAFGTTIHLIEGEANNIKITQPIDLLVAEKILEMQHPK